MYENTTPELTSMAAELIQAGVDPHDVYRRLYEDLPFRAPAAARAGAVERRAPRRRRDHGRALTSGDFEETEALETDSEGIVDHLRAVEGTKVAVLVRELLADDRDGKRKVSLRATDGRGGRLRDRADHRAAAATARRPASPPSCPTTS